MKHTYGIYAQRVFFALFISIAMIVDGSGDMIPISFDSPFPSTPFKQVLSLCMQTWSSFGLLKNSSLQDADREFIGDAILGRIIRLHHEIKIMIHDKEKELEAPEDIVYLITLVDRLHALSYAHVDMFSSVFFVQEKIKDIKNLCAQFLAQG